jgi:uncharacterized membrane protein HdeD (DUF308 family)
MATYVLARNYWLIVLRGSVAALFGLVMFILPTPTLAALRVFLGLYLLIDGLLAASAGLNGYNGSRPWRLLLINGVLSIGAGSLILAVPSFTALTVLYLISVWAIATGLVELVSAFRLRTELDNEGFLALSGVASVALGAVLMMWPGVITSHLILLFGAYMLVFGLLLIGLGLKLWDWQKSVGPTPLYFAPGLQLRRASHLQPEEVVKRQSR